ncbi:MAG TPA: glycosyltransferase family 39 protein, partial [Caldilineaceae bacterium]|nr:glycosyltransferase family 39 protein [Caldilineaceae bacterium]
AVATAFLLGRRLLGPVPALIGAGLVAVTFWTVLLSRIGYRANALPVLFPLWLVSFWRCRHRHDLAPYLLAGLLLGLAQYTYTAARFLPILAVVLAWDWRKTLTRRGLLVGLGVALLVVLPLAWAIASAPEIGNQRIRQAALWNRPEPWSLLWLQLRSHLLMFGFGGDPLWIHNLPNRPPVALPLALLFVIGVVAGWRRPAERALCWSVLVLLWPGILAVSNNPAPPDHLRVIVVATPVMLLVGAGLLRLTRPWPQWLLTLAVLLIVIEGALSWRDYR